MNSRIRFARSPRLVAVPLCSAVAAAIAFTMRATSSIERATWSLPFACSAVARAISAIDEVAFSISSMIRTSPSSAFRPSFSPCPASTDTASASSTASETSRRTFSMRSRISSVERLVRSESSRISSATTAKPRPRSPACAAMIAAFRASRFVWSVIPSMTPTMLPISSERTPSRPIASRAFSTMTRTEALPPALLVTASRPRKAASETRSARVAASRALRPTSMTVAAISAIDDDDSMASDSSFSAFVATREIDEAMSVTAVVVSPT